MKSPIIPALSAMAIALSACVGTPAAYEAAAVKPAEAPKGYLARQTLETLAAAIPAPPLPGSAEEAADRALSQSFRQFENSDRWLLATSHAEVRLPFALQHFDCALNVRFDPDRNLAPVTTRLLHKLFEDGEAASTIVKLRAHRARPVGDDADRLACQNVSPAGRASPSYPSGSATVAAAYGHAMAAIAPEHADAAIETGHQIAFSRAICGMHYPRDVEVGEQLGKAVFEAASQSPEFQADLALARAEIEGLRRTGATNPGCAAERQALARTVAAAR